MQLLDFEYLLEKKKVTYYERLRDSTGKIHEVQLRPPSAYISYLAYEIVDIEYMDTTCAKITIRHPLTVSTERS